MEKLIIAAAVVAAIAFYAANAAPLPRQSRTVDPEKLPDGSICHTRVSKIVIASEAKQSTAPPAEKWIASSLSLLAMTVCPEGQTCPASTGQFAGRGCRSTYRDRLLFRALATDG
jgi:hypothetical protein